MVRRLSRKTFLSRLLTAVLVVAFTASFTGVGGAAPLNAGSQETSATPVVADPTPIEAPQEEPTAGEDAAEVPEEPAPDEEAATQQPVVETESEPAASRTDVVGDTSPTMVPAAVSPAGTGVTMTFEGYRPSADGWTTGNIDPTSEYYFECDYVPLRLVIENKGTTTWTGSPVVLLDHFDGAVGWDATRGDADGQDWYFYTSATAPTTGDSQNPTGSRISVEDTFPGGYGSSTYLRVPLPALNIPAGQYGVVYFQAHLALTHYWNQQNGEDGSQAWPGASLHCTLEEGGAKTLPIPVPPAPPGHIDGLKFEDAPPLGSYEGEPGLPGWQFTLTAGGQFPFTLTAESAADGTFSFAGLPGNTYSITEQAGPTVPAGDWMSEYGPQTVVLPRGGSDEIEFGNYLPPAIDVSISKDARPVHVGVDESITYDVVVTNTGDSTLTSLVLTDPMDPSSPRTQAVSLAKNGTYEYSYTAAAPAGGWTSDPVHNTVSVSASDNYGQSDTASANKDVDVVHPNIEVEKYSLPAGPVIPGTPVQYFFRVHNLGDLDLTVDLTDFEGTIDALGSQLFTDSVFVAAGTSELVPGPTFSITAPAVDTVLASGYDEHGHGDEDYATYSVGLHPAVNISVAKTARDTSIGVDESVTYDVVVTNDGPGIVTSLDLVDAMDSASPRTATGLSLGTGDTYEYSYTAAPPAGGWSVDPIENTVTATGHDGFGQSDVATADEEVDVVHPDIRVLKSANFSGSAPYGAEVFYTFEIGNHGDVDLDVTLTDTILPGYTDYAVGMVSVGTTVTVNAPAYELLADTSNTVTVTGDDGDGHTDTDSDTYDLEMVPQTIQVGISKTPRDTSIGTDESVTYDVVVTNTGVSTLTALTLTDPMDPDSPRTVTGLSLGTDETYEYSYTAAPPASGWATDPVENTVSVTATDQFGQTDIATADAEVDVVHPDIEVEKYSVPGGPVVPGTPVQYFFRVYNNGDVDLNVSLADYLGDITAAGDPAGLLWFGSISLAAGTDTLVPGPTFPVTAPMVDTIIAAGNDGDGHGDTAWATYGIGVYPAVNISVAKTARDTSIGVDESVTYDVVVTNDGPGIVTSLDLVDAMDSASPRTATGLSLGTGDTYEYSYTAAPPAGGWSVDPIENTVTATGHDGFGQSDVATADEEVDVVHPDIRVLKSANFSGSAPYGAEVFYTFEIGNHGDVDLDVTLTDTILPGYTDYAVGMVSVGTTVTVNAPAYELLADTSNTVTVTGDDGDGHTDTDSDTYDLEMVPPSIDVAIAKTPRPDHVDADDSITYDIVVTNTGASTLTALTLTDPMDPDSPRTVTGLMLQSQGTYSYSYTAVAPAGGWMTDPVENTVIVEGSDAFEQSDTATAEAEVDVIHPDVEVEKYSVPAGPVEPGTAVQYYYDIGNHGDVPLTVDVEDRLGEPADDGELLFDTTVEIAVDTTVTVTGANEIITDNTTNTVTVIGDDGDGHGDEAMDTYSIEVFMPFTMVDMSVEKTADRKTADPGDTIIYTITYTNLGDAPVDDFTVTDDFDERYATVTDAGGGAVADGKIVWHVVETLLPGESGTIVYKVKLDDEMPQGETHVDNVVVLTTDGDENPDNDRSTWRVTVAFLPFTPKPEPFLPFTGGEAATLLLGAAAAALLGGALRRRGRAA